MKLILAVSNTTVEVLHFVNVKQVHLHTACVETSQLINKSSERFPLIWKLNS